MAKVKQNVDETVRIHRFALDGTEMLDIRFWKKTETGPKPTEHGISMGQDMIVNLIISLQKVRSQIESDAAKQESGVV